MPDRPACFLAEPHFEIRRQSARSTRPTERPYPVPGAENKLLDAVQFMASKLMGYRMFHERVAYRFRR